MVRTMVKLVVLHDLLGLVGDVGHVNLRMSVSENKSPAAYAEHLLGASMSSEEREDTGAAANVKNNLTLRAVS